ncbi:MAG TPA: SMR family transporter [Nocardioidaceae bacterium]|jgi:small multidrug resistance pump|nr:SMR family transporter [Nocardioidaceae bacterium]
MLFTAALLATAVAVEVAATAALPRAAGFTAPGWSIAVCSGYALSIWLLSVVVRTMPVSVAYAVWAGLGTALVAVVGATFLGERLDAVSVSALAMIIVGVVVLNAHGVQS